MIIGTVWYYVHGNCWIKEEMVFRRGTLKPKLYSKCTEIANIIENHIIKKNKIILLVVITGAISNFVRNKQ